MCFTRIRPTARLLREGNGDRGGIGGADYPVNGYWRGCDERHPCYARLGGIQNRNRLLHEIILA